MHVKSLQNAGFRSMRNFNLSHRPLPRKSRGRAKSNRPSLLARVQDVCGSLRTRSCRSRSRDEGQGRLGQSFINHGVMRVVAENVENGRNCLPACPAIQGTFELLNGFMQYDVQCVPTYVTTPCSRSHELFHALNFIIDTTSCASKHGYMVTMCATEQALSSQHHESTTASGIVRVCTLRGYVLGSWPSVLRIVELGTIAVSEWSRMNRPM